MGFPLRYPKQPWTYDARDLMPVGDPETIVFLPQGETLVGLHIVGLDVGDRMIGIRCDELGRPETCVLGSDLAVDVTVQSNPRRRADGEDMA